MGVESGKREREKEEKKSYFYQGRKSPFLHTGNGGREGGRTAEMEGREEAEPDGTFKS